MNLKLRSAYCTVIEFKCCLSVCLSLLLIVSTAAAASTAQQVVEILNTSGSTLAPGSVPFELAAAALPGLSSTAVASPGITPGDVAMGDDDDLNRLSQASSIVSQPILQRNSECSTKHEQGRSSKGGGGGSGSPETPRNFKFSLCTVHNHMQYIPF